MTEPQAAPPPSRSMIAKAAPGILVSVAALAILFALVDFEEFVANLKLADYRYFAVVIAMFIGTLAARAMAWRTILQEQITFQRSFLTLNEGYLFNNVLPFRLGELARAFMLNKTSRIPFWEGLSTIMVERVIDLGILAGLLLGTVPFVVGAEWALQAAYTAAVLVPAAFIALFYFASNPDKAISVYSFFTKPVPKLSEWGRDKLESFLTGLAAITEFSRFAKVIFFMLLAWAFNIAWYAVLLNAFAPGTSMLTAAFMVGVVALGVAAPSSPAYIGVFEAATVGALALFNFDEAVSLAYAIVAHSVYFIITVAIGGYALGRDGQSLGAVFRGIRNRDMGGAAK